MYKYVISALLIALSADLCAQVGIGTTDPQQELDVNGRVRIQDVTKTGANLNGAKLLATEPDGTVVEIESDDLSIDSSGKVSVIGGSVTSNGGSTFSVKAVDLGGVEDDVDNLDLDLDGLNADTNMFILQNTDGDITITGIAGGTEGRHIILVNDTDDDIEFEFEDSGSSAANRILRFTNDDELRSNNSDGRSRDGQGSIHLVYTDAVTGSGRWIAYQMDQGDND